MNKVAQIITNRLSLRPPQAESLEILATLADELELKKEVDLGEELKKVKALYPTCNDFERDFPSVCFALATGVGKTRLMGAFISYLFSAKGIKNYFVLAPNLTIYNKLIDDLSNPRSEKYVFRGISEFAVTPPRIITGDNYNEARETSLFGETVKINIFNISKINSEVRGGSEPRIKRLSEYLGESYFSYLSSLPDLVLLMDESHHYRAASGMRAINELKPILGLELTATPKMSSGTRGNDKFKNVVYEYSLAKAMRDGFVKEPSVATRKNFNPLNYHNDPKELDLLKLEDGIRFHADTQAALEVYSRNTNSKLVKPFMLVVTRNTDHASEIKELIESDRFFNGRYKGKVIEVHSRQTGAESDENIEKLVNLERPDNQVEIVIHVNMLKEGWDVTNLYTIVPLRAANAEILIEQTIGRGLRLPYGRRTGFKKADTLTIIAHDKFQAIIDAANSPDSIIKMENIIEIDPEDIPVEQEVITVTSNVMAEIEEKQKAIDQISNEAEKRTATLELEAQKMIISAVQSMSVDARNVNDLKSDEIKKIAIAKMVERMEAEPQQSLFKREILETAKKEYETVIDDLLKNIIPIPRIVIQQKGDIKAIFHDFNLDTKSLNYQPVSKDLVRQSLQTNEKEVVYISGGSIGRNDPISILVNELINYSTIEYDKHAELLYKLARQAVEKLDNGNEEELKNIILYYKKEIAGYIYAQMEQNFELKSSGFEDPHVYPFSKIESHNYTKSKADEIHRYTETINPTRDIPNKIFGGFTKSCHNLYKFDSKAEKDFAVILESDKEAIRWLRPALSQFSLYWQHNSRRYIPDFVVETKDKIYLVEIKAEIQMNDAEVKEKAAAGQRYCEVASSYNASNGGKEWQYVLIPHSIVAPNMDLQGLLGSAK